MGPRQGRASFFLLFLSDRGKSLQIPVAPTLHVKAFDSAEAGLKLEQPKHLPRDCQTPNKLKPTGVITVVPFLPCTAYNVAMSLAAQMYIPSLRCVKPELCHSPRANGDSPAAHGPKGLYFWCKKVKTTSPVTREVQISFPVRTVTFPDSNGLAPVAVGRARGRTHRSPWPRSIQEHRREGCPGHVRGCDERAQHVRFPEHPRARHHQVIPDLFKTKTSWTAALSCAWD